MTGGEYDVSDLFTLAMVDAGAVGTDESAGQVRHWLVNNVSLTAPSLGSLAGMSFGQFNCAFVVSYGFWRD